MKKLNKKGFTIVELVIVIAVIAILSAVLIPTFSGVVGEANKTAVVADAKAVYQQYMTANITDYEANAIYSDKGYYVVIKDANVFETTGENKTSTFASQDEAMKAAFGNDYDTTYETKLAGDNYKGLSLVTKKAPANNG